MRRREDFFLCLSDSAQKNVQKNLSDISLSLKAKNVDLKEYEIVKLYEDIILLNKEKDGCEFIRGGIEREQIAPSDSSCFFDKPSKRVLKYKPTRETIIPAMVGMVAIEIPDAIALALPVPVTAIISNTLIIPVTVPSKPISGQIITSR